MLAVGSACLCLAAAAPAFGDHAPAPEPPQPEIPPAAATTVVVRAPESIQLAQHVRVLERKVAARGRLIRRLRGALHERAISGSLLGPFLCIHSYEGSWRDSGAPYWGGLQMDWGFMRRYGGPLLNALGTADRWPPAAQIAVATIAYYEGRGFYPWPNTARSCGLL